VRLTLRGSVHEPENSNWGDSQHVGQFESD
jgi:hypothetical protein